MRNTKRTQMRRRKQAGAALLLCIFVICFVTVMVVNVLDTTTIELSALRQGMEYQRALYLANAGVHQVAAFLEEDPSWRGTISEGNFPDDDSFTAVTEDGPSSTVIVTSTGVAGLTQRSVQAVFQL